MQNGERMNPEELKLGVVYRWIVEHIGGESHPCASERFVLTRIDLTKNEADWEHTDGRHKGHAGTITDLDFLWETVEA